MNRMEQIIMALIDRCSRLLINLFNALDEAMAARQVARKNYPYLPEE
jgi:hypothetical protein